MLIYDKYTQEYYEVVPVRKIQERIKELQDLLVDPLCADNVRFRIAELKLLIKENTEGEE